MNATDLPSEGKTRTIWAIGLLATFWLACAVGGLYVVWAYDNAPGPSGVRPVPSGRSTPRWCAPPIARLSCCSRTRNAPARPRALGELAEALARAARASPRPTSCSSSLRRCPTDGRRPRLWRTARTRFPTRRSFSDDDGSEAERFGAVTSGETLVYDAARIAAASAAASPARADTPATMPAARRSSSSSTSYPRPPRRPTSSVARCSPRPSHERHSRPAIDRAARQRALRRLSARHPPADRSAVRRPDGVPVAARHRLRAVGVAADVGRRGEQHAPARVGRGAARRRHQPVPGAARLVPPGRSRRRATSSASRRC